MNTETSAAAGTAKAIVRIAAQINFDFNGNLQFTVICHPANFYRPANRRRLTSNKHVATQNFY